MSCSVWVVGDIVRPYSEKFVENFLIYLRMILQERFCGHDFSKSTFPQGFVAFGGGRYMCPGRWYAIMELVMVISLFFHQFDITLDDEIPQPVRESMIFNPFIL